jgi:hypothetical protein
MTFWGSQQKEGELLNAMWHTWIGRLQRTKIIEAQATIPPCQLQGNFANWRAKNLRKDYSAREKST